LAAASRVVKEPAAAATSATDLQPTLGMEGVTVLLGEPDTRGPDTTTGGGTGGAAGALCFRWWKILGFPWAGSRTWASAAEGKGEGGGGGGHSAWHPRSASELEVQDAPHSLPAMGTASLPRCIKGDKLHSPTLENAKKRSAASPAFILMSSGDGAQRRSDLGGEEIL
jgi:hypothetical protein